MGNKKFKDYKHPNIGSTIEEWMDELGPEFKKEVSQELIQFAWSEARLAVKKKKVDDSIKLLEHIKKLTSEVMGTL